LIYSLPVLLESGLPALAARLMVHGLIALGLWLGLERTDLTPGQRRTTWLAIADPCFRGARLDPAARAVAAPIAPPWSDGGSGAPDARRTAESEVAWTNC
jgi:hypothetical protein